MYFFQVRERLRTAQERNIVLEDELMLANQEVSNNPSTIPMTSSLHHLATPLFPSDQVTTGREQENEANDSTEKLGANEHVLR